MKMGTEVALETRKQEDALAWTSQSCRKLSTPLARGRGTAGLLASKESSFGGPFSPHAPLPNQEAKVTFSDPSKPRIRKAWS